MFLLNFIAWSEYILFQLEIVCIYVKSSTMQINAVLFLNVFSLSLFLSRREVCKKTWRTIHALFKCGFTSYWCAARSTFWVRAKQFDSKLRLHISCKTAKWLIKNAFPFPQWDSQITAEKFSLEQSWGKG